MTLAEASSAARGQLAGTGPRRAGRRGTAVAGEAFIRSLYAEHGAALRRYAVQLTSGDQHCAEDLVQETIIRAWRHPEAIDGRPPLPWLVTVMRHLAVDAYRARQARAAEAGEAALASLPAAAGDTDRVVQSIVVDDALASLRPAHRRVLTEIYYQGRTAPQAAAALGVPVGTIKSRTFYALRSLKAALEARGLEL